MILLGCWWLATCGWALNLEHRTFSTSFIEPVTPWYDVSTETFTREVMTPILTQAWTFRGLREETRLANFWSGSCVPDLVNATAFSTTTDVHLCRKKLHFQFQRFSQNPSSSTPTCTPVSGYGLLQQSYSVVASINSAVEQFGGEYSLFLTVQSFDLYSPPGTPFPNCTGHVALPTAFHYDMMNAVCYMIDRPSKQWWNGATPQIYTTMMLNYDQTAQGGARQAQFASLFLEIPDGNALSLSGPAPPGSTPFAQLSFSTAQSVYLYGDEQAVDPQHDVTFCNSEDQRYMDPGIVFIDIGEPYVPVTAGDLGSCASIDFVESLGVSSSTLIFDILNTPHLFLSPSAPQPANPTPASPLDVLNLTSIVFSTPTNFKPINQTGFAWYPPLNPNSLVDSVQLQPQTGEYGPVPGPANPSAYGLTYHIAKTIDQLANCTRPGVSGSLVSRVPDGQGGLFISFWVTAHHLQGLPDVEQVFLTSVSMQFNIQLDAFGQVVLLSDSRQDSESRLVGVQDIRGAAAHCPDNQVRLSITWNLIHRSYDNLGFFDQVGVLRADDIYRYRGGGCYGFPATTNAAPDPIDSTFMWPRARSETQQDNLRLVFNPALMFSQGTMPNSWDPSWALAGHSGINPCDHPGVSGDQTAYARCRACTICHADADLGYCRVTDPTDATQTVPLTGAALDSCVAYCNSTVLPDVCYEARPGKLRTVTVSLPNCFFGNCHQYVTILSDCFNVFQPNFFYDACPYNSAPHVTPPTNNGHFAFLYDAYDCQLEPTNQEPYRRFDRPCAKITESTRSFVDATPRHNVFQQENTTFGQDTEVALFGQSNYYWEQNFEQNGGPSPQIASYAAAFAPGSIVTMGVRAIDPALRDTIPRRIYAVTVCRVQRNIADYLSTLVMNNPNTLTCSHPSIETAIGAMPQNPMFPITMVGSSFVSSSHKFLISGAATTTCTLDPFANTLCVQPQFMPKPVASPTVFTSRPGGAFRMCRREPLAQFNETLLFDDNQFVGCDGVGLLSSTILAELGALRSWEIYFAEITTQSNFIDTRPIGGRRLLSTQELEGSNEEEIRSINTVGFIIIQGNVTTGVVVVSGTSTTRRLNDGSIAAIVLAILLTILLVVVIVMCCGGFGPVGGGGGSGRWACCNYNSNKSSSSSTNIATTAARSSPSEPSETDKFIPTV